MKENLSEAPLSEKKSILVVDDEPALRGLLKRALENKGFYVLPAADGQTALDSILAHRPDMVLLDLHLPEMSGMEVCRRIRQAASALGYIPIIVITGISLEEAKSSGIQADDYVGKPFDLEDLLSRITRLLQEPSDGQNG
ncbi:MAG: response regulator transcription factor [Elusimicrobia bacterium]|nr:response regulator transcription factor [Elusimicrobiota bacterium]